MLQKKNPKYVKKIPKPGGGYYYIYPDQIKQQWDSFAKKSVGAIKKEIPTRLKLKAAKAELKYRIGKTDIAKRTGLSDAMKYSTAKKYGTKLDQAINKKRFNKTPMGKVSNFVGDAVDNVRDGATDASKNLNKIKKKAKKKIKKLFS